MLPSECKEYLIAENPLMRKIFEDVGTLAKSTASVFISGESGTGKEVIAQEIHRQSHRAKQAFIKVNCAAIPGSLLESEFFGHEKGSFTGAIQRRIGRFELADKGTLLLDEISEIPLELQPKLLRAVQEMEFERVGGSQPIQVDVRLISTSNRSMKQAIEQKLFREDLYYRLNVVPIYLPTLRDRREDIIPLAEYFLQRLCGENGKRSKNFTPEAKKMLMDYPWPGNIRELANVVERTVVMHGENSIDCLHVQFDISPTQTAPFFPAGLTLKELEKNWILRTLEREKNNKTRTAHVLGISVRTLRNKLKEYYSAGRDSFPDR
ncbi:MAG TPA: sigma-54 dependent transcriptional regulator [Rhabdochlamydiaceae bacterium]|jgi:two-component system response regulator AtoC